MKTRKNAFIRMLSLLLSLVIFASIPISAFASTTTDGDYGVSAVAASYPAKVQEMMNHSAFKALKYLGYDSKNELQNSGNLFTLTGSGVEKNYPKSLTNIGYSGGAGSGLETSSTNTGYTTVTTATGKYPKVAAFEKPNGTGLDCVDYIAYYLTNYLPNIEGKDISELEAIRAKYGYRFDDKRFWPGAISDFQNAGIADIWTVEDINTNNAKITEYTDPDGTTKTDDIYNYFEPGTLIVMGVVDNKGNRDFRHFAIYAGTWNGKHYIYHCGNNRGPEINIVEYMWTYETNTDKQSYPLYFMEFDFPGFEEYGSITVRKVDSNNNTVLLTGAGFKAVNQDSGKSYALLETENGIYSRDDLPLAVYRIYETKAPAGYTQIDPANPRYVRTVDLTQTGNENVTFTVTNTQLGQLLVKKITNTGNYLSGWRFAVNTMPIDAANENYPYILTTGSTGEKSLDLPAGTYYVKELGHETLHSSMWEAKTPGWVEVKVPGGAVKTVTFENILNGGSLQIQKKTSDGTNLAGWTFRLERWYTGELFYSDSTDENGQVVVEGLLPGPYYVTEIGGPDSEWWIMDDSTKTTIISNDIMNYLEFENIHLGMAQVEKDTNTGAAKAGWVFGFYTDELCQVPALDKDGNHITVTTDSTGIGQVKLPAGTYWAQEIGGPAGYWDSDWWQCDKEPKKIEVVGGKLAESAKFKATNTYLGKLRVEKTVNVDTLEGNWIFDIYTDEACTMLYRTVEVPSNSFVEILVPMGSYWVKEQGHTKIADIYWSLYDGIQPKQEVFVVGGTLYDDAIASFDNTVYGELQVTKTANTDMLAGWQFTVYTDEACTTVAKDKFGNDAVLTTDADGSASIILEAGQTYWVKETGGHGWGSDYWICDGSLHSVTVLPAETAEVTPFHNKQIGFMQIIKEMTDGSSPEGWQFKVTRLSGNADLGIFTTDADGNIRIPDLEPGDYLVEEIIPEGSIYECITENPVTVTVEPGKTAPVSFKNAPIPVSLTVKKVDPYGNVLAGAEFTLEWSEDGANWQTVTFGSTLEKGACSSEDLLNGTLTTGESGIVTFSGLYPGLHYRLQETKAPNGYVLQAGSVFEGIISTAEPDVVKEVVNHSVFTLPNSGSAEISQVTFAGICLMLLAVLLSAAFAVVNKKTTL